MICPKCSAETRILDARTHPEDAKVVVRRRQCVSCGHRITTHESTARIVGIRTRKAEAAPLASVRRPPTAEERRLAEQAKEATKMRRAARAEARNTGRPLSEIMREWKVPAPHSLPRQQAQR